MNKRGIITTFHVERDYAEIVLDVKGTVYFGHPGRISGPPEDCFPPEGDEVFIESVTHNGKPFDLTDKETEELEQMLMNEANDTEDDPPSYDPYDNDDSVDDDYLDCSSPYSDAYSDDGGF